MIRYAADFYIHKPSSPWSDTSHKSADNITRPCFRGFRFQNFLADMPPDPQEKSRLRRGQPNLQQSDFGARSAPEYQGLRAAHVASTPVSREINYKHHEHMLFIPKLIVYICSARPFQDEHIQNLSPFLVRGDTFQVLTVSFLSYRCSNVEAVSPSSSPSSSQFIASLSDDVAKG